MNKLFTAKNILISLFIAITVAFLSSFVMYLAKANEIVITKGDFKRYFPDDTTKVVVYGNSTCHFCKNAREFLSTQGIKFADYNIDQSKNAAAQFAELKGDSVPIIIVGEEKIIGFHEKELREMLARNLIAPPKP